MTRVFIGLMIVLGGSSACTDRIGRLFVNVTRSSGASEDPFDGIAAFVRLRVDGPFGRSGPTTFRLAEERGALTDLEPGAGQVLTVEGLGPEENTVSRGRSSPLLIAGGDNALNLFVARLDRFSQTPKEGWLAAEGMSVGRAFHRAVDGHGMRLLLVGGVTQPWRPTEPNQPLEATSLVDDLDANGMLFAERDCQAVGKCLAQPLILHEIAWLPSGNALIIGGVAQPQSGALSPTSQTTIYSATEDSFFAGPELKAARYAHAVAVWQDGVAIVGGIGADGRSTSLVELFVDGEIRNLPRLSQPRRNPTLTVLNDGRLWAVGGSDDGGAPLATTEFLAPGSARWAAGPVLGQARARHRTLSTADGVFVVGGLGAGGIPVTAIERLNPDTDTLTDVGKLKLGRWGHTVSDLGDGRVMVVGGFTGSAGGSPTPTVEFLSGLFGQQVQVLTGPRMRRARGGHTTNLLRPGVLVVIGGVTQDAQGSRVVGDAEVFTY
ncbi:MAG: hypothetical protein H6707_13890 [Deltaproteobacteria bacterium]|nr:hypothetical protein [Deltaproteobacteria bacterium]